MDPAPDRAVPSRPPPPQSPGALLIGWVRWFGVGRLVVTGVAVVAVIAGGFWLLRTPAAPIESTLPRAAPGPTSSTLTSGSVGPAPAALATTTSSVPPAEIVVHVSGAVVTPGVYVLSADARVQDAVDAAGGMAADADHDAINLAGFVTDGARVYVPRLGVPVPSVLTPGGAGSPAGVPTGAPAAPAGPIDLNTATIDQLDELPGVGPSTAAAIVAHRDTSGPYAAVDDLLEVRGIGPAKLEAIRDLVTV